MEKRQAITNSSQFASIRLLDGVERCEHYNPQLSNTVNQKASCPQGNKCKNSHGLRICKYFINGHCRQEEKCPYKHFSVECYLKAEKVVIREESLAFIQVGDVLHSKQGMT